jgi:hypothetical protein
MEEDILAKGEDPSLFPILNSRPEMFSDLLWIWEGFMCLSQTRQFGMAAPQPISLVDINAYCEFRDISDPDDRDDFLYHVRNMDRVWMQEWQARHPTKNNKTPGTPRGLGQG